jgi:hypothetical protein
MSLARKGARKITVDGKEYRWKVSVDSGYFTIVVQLASGTGQRLEARTAFGRNWGDARPITPAGIASLIRVAIDEGWAPSSEGSPHRMNDVDGRVRLDGETAQQGAGDPHAAQIQAARRPRRT